MSTTPIAAAAAYAAAPVAATPPPPAVDRDADVDTAEAAPQSTPPAGVGENVDVSV
jgi:hypothetical protein